MDDPKPTRGGARKGAGAPKKPPGTRVRDGTSVDISIEDAEIIDLHRGGMSRRAWLMWCARECAARLRGEE